MGLGVRLRNVLFFGLGFFLFGEKKEVVLKGVMDEFVNESDGLGFFL